VPVVVLASASVARARLLGCAGVPFAVDAAAVDEAAVRESMHADGAAAADVALALAALKAVRVSPRHPDALVIGADQMLECNGRWFDKPVDREHARAQLLALRGRSHELVSAVCVARNASVIWRQVDMARLTMRAFSEQFLERYLAQAGEEVCGSVGAYRVEGLGAQLFSSIEGSHFTIVGLPLLSLLGLLREHQVVGE
jgi:septum formation protein